MSWYAKRCLQVIEVTAEYEWERAQAFFDGRGADDQLQAELDARVYSIDCDWVAFFVFEFNLVPSQNADFFDAVVHYSSDITALITEFGTMAALLEERDFKGILKRLWAIVRETSFDPYCKVWTDKVQRRSGAHPVFTGEKVGYADNIRDEKTYEGGYSWDELRRINLVVKTTGSLPVEVSINSIAAQFRVMQEEQGRLEAELPELYRLVSALLKSNTDNYLLQYIASKYRQVVTGDPRDVILLDIDALSYLAFKFLETAGVYLSETIKSVFSEMGVDLDTIANLLETATDVAAFLHSIKDFFKGVIEAIKAKISGLAFLTSYLGNLVEGLLKDDFDKYCVVKFNDDVRKGQRYFSGIRAMTGHPIVPSSPLVFPSPPPETQTQPVQQIIQSDDKKLENVITLLKQILQTDNIYPKLQSLFQLNMEQFQTLSVSAKFSLLDSYYQKLKQKNQTPTAEVVPLEPSIPVKKSSDVREHDKMTKPSQPTPPPQTSQPTQPTTPPGDYIPPNAHELYISSFADAVISSTPMQDPPKSFALEYNLLYNTSHEVKGKQFMGKQQREFTSKHRKRIMRLKRLINKK